MKKDKSTPEEKQNRKIIDMLESKTECALGLQMLRDKPLGEVRQILNKVNFNKEHGAKRMPMLPYRVMIVLSMFEVDIEKLSEGYFKSRHIVIEGMWDRFARLDQNLTPLKDFELHYSIYNYSPTFCELIGIKKTNPVS